MGLPSAWRTKKTSLARSSVKYMEACASNMSCLRPSSPAPSNKQHTRRHAWVVTCVRFVPSDRRELQRLSMPRAACRMQAHAHWRAPSAREYTGGEVTAPCVVVRTCAGILHACTCRQKRVHICGQRWCARKTCKHVCESSRRISQAIPPRRARSAGRAAGHADLRRTAANSMACAAGSRAPELVKMFFASRELHHRELIGARCGATRLLLTGMRARAHTHTHTHKASHCMPTQMAKRRPRDRRFQASSRTRGRDEHGQVMRTGRSRLINGQRPKDFWTC
jgi:hypothetical protein